MFLTILIVAALLAMATMVFAMARVSARADRVAHEQRGQVESELGGAADSHRATG